MINVQNALIFTGKFCDINCFTFILWLLSCFYVMLIVVLFTKKQFLDLYVNS